MLHAGRFDRHQGTDGAKLAADPELTRDPMSNGRVTVNANLHSRASPQGIPILPAAELPKD